MGSEGGWGGLRAGVAKVSSAQRPEGGKEGATDVECSWQRSQRYKGSWVGACPGWSGSVRRPAWLGQVNGRQQ